MELIVISTALAVNLHNALRTAADRGAYKLEEFGAVAQIVEELVKSLRENKLPAVAPAPVTKTPEEVVETKE